MAVGKHASRAKSFEDLEFNRKERGRRKRRQRFDEEELEDKLNIDNDMLNSNADEYDDEYDDSDGFWDDEPQIDYKKIAIIVVAVIIVILSVFGIYKFVVSKNEEKDVIQEDSSQTNIKEMPTSISGYKVLGQVVIKDLKIEQYILNLPEDEALKNGVAKLYGSSLNSVGNFCIVGHNYEGIFKDIEKLNVGDEITIKDTKYDEYKYKVTSVKTVEPDNLECLMQNTEKVEITLITCSTGATSRVVVKAEQVAKDNK